MKREFLKMKSNQNNPLEFELKDYVTSLIKEQIKREYEEEEEIQNYQSLIENLKNYPNSIRIFSEVFQKSLEIISKRGIYPRFFIFEDGRYNNYYPLKDVRISIHYLKRNPFTDKLAIHYYNSGNESTLSLLRSRGNLSIQKFTEEDIVSKITRGKEPIKNIFRLQPSSLMIEENKKTKWHDYGFIKHS